MSCDEIVFIKSRAKFCMNYAGFPSRNFLFFIFARFLVCETCSRIFFSVGFF